MNSNNISVNQLLGEGIQTEVIEMEDGSEYEIELITPENFLAALKNLGVEELSEAEVQCLMMILVKPELDNAIVVADL